jgi:hypothetical protein
MTPNLFTTERKSCGQAPTLSPYRNRPLKRRAPTFRAEAPNPGASDIEDVTVDTPGGHRRLLTLLEGADQ